MLLYMARALLRPLSQRVLCAKQSISKAHEQNSHSRALPELLFINPSFSRFAQTRLSAPARACMHVASAQHVLIGAAVSTCQQRQLQTCSSYPAYVYPLPWLLRLCCGPAGHLDGSVCLWDVRQCQKGGSAPIGKLPVHTQVGTHAS